MEKLKTTLIVLFIIFTCYIVFHSAHETSTDDLGNYHGYTIKEVCFSRSISTVTLQDSTGHVVEKLFNNDEIAKAITGLKIK